MFKLGRGSGGGRGNVKRSVHPPPSGRPIGAASRSSLPGVRGRGAPPPEAPASGQGREETFSMVSSEVLDFGAIIRLAPDLVDEIRRAEARGGAVRIKFDPNLNDPLGNVLDVDGKEFKFTWSRDSGDLCNIYEECHNGEDEQGQLVERGSAWRKLNVQRILDESIKNHVKMRSEEAERRNKSRKAIVLDPANPSVKNQSSAAVEGSMRRMHWNKKREPVFKKQKVESGQGTFNPTLKMESLKHTNRNSPSVSPLPSPPEKVIPDSLASPLGLGTTSKNHATIDSGNTLTKVDTVDSEKELTGKGSLKMPDKVMHRKSDANSLTTDMRSFLITILSENPKGMSLKAIEKTVGESMICSPRNIERVLKNIANFQAPGRYLLKPGVGVDSNAKLMSESGSSPDPEIAPPEEKALPLIVETITAESDHEINMHSLDEPGSLGQTVGKSNEQEPSPDAFANDAKVDNDSDGKACSSSDSESDSDSDSDSSDSSDSRSQSRSPAGSRSASRSPAGSRSASSSGSESDGSSSSKGTDGDVNITTSDDDNDELDNKSFAAKLISSSLPDTLTNYNEPHDQSGVLGDQQDDTVPHSSHFPERSFDDALAVENIKDMPFDDTFGSSKNPQVDIVEEKIELIDSKSNLIQFDERMPFVAHTQKHPVNGQVYSFCDPAISTHKQRLSAGREKPNGLNDVLDHERCHVSGKTPKTKLKRPSDYNDVNENVESTKKPRPMEYSGQRRDSNASELQLVPDKSDHNQFFGITKGAAIIMARDSAGDNDLLESSIVPERSNTYSTNLSKKGHGPDFQSGTSFVSSDSGRTGDRIGKRKPFNTEKSARWTESCGTVSKRGEKYAAYSEEPEFPTLKKKLPKDISNVKGKYHRDSLDENPDSGEKYNGSVRDSNLGGRPSLHESILKNLSEQPRNQKDDFMNSNIQKSDMDKMPGDSGKGSVLKRELSDLELGEFREPTGTEALQGNKASIERKGSFEISENVVNIDDDLQSDFRKRKNPSNFSYESKKQSPVPENRNRNSQDGLQRKPLEVLGKPLQQTAALHSQPSRRTEQANLENKSNVDRFSDPSWGDGTRGNHWRNPVDSDANVEEGSRPFVEHVQQRESRYMAERLQKKDSDLNIADGKNGSLKRDGNSNTGNMEASEDNATLFFSKFEKDEPDLRGPIRDYLQYTEYLKEFEEKYSCYLSLSESMEKTRVEFLKIAGNFPELAKGKDKKVYNDCCRKIIRFCNQNKKRDNRIKKTFILLHEELRVLKQRIKEFNSEYSKD